MTLGPLALAVGLGIVALLALLVGLMGINPRNRDEP